MDAFCKQDNIEVAHGSPRTPRLTWEIKLIMKEDMQALILSTLSKNL